MVTLKISDKDAKLLRIALSEKITEVEEKIKFWEKLSAVYPDTSEVSISMLNYQKILFESGCETIQRQLKNNDASHQ